MDSAPPNLPELPDYEVEVCGCAHNGDAVDCFYEALGDGRGAELFSVGSTFHAEPFYDIARATPQGDIEIYNDSSRDRRNSGVKFDVQTGAAAGFRIVADPGDGYGYFATGECSTYSVGW